MRRGSALAAPGGPRTGHDGLIVMLPRSELAEIVWDDAGLFGTVTVLEPT